MRTCARWLIGSPKYTFDRLYFYGTDRPIHISFSAAPQREIVEIVELDNGKEHAARMAKVSKLSIVPMNAPSRLFDSALGDINAGRTLFTAPQDFRSYAVNLVFVEANRVVHQRRI